MVEHIDRLTFGPSLNESENPVNNFFFLTALSLIFWPRGAFLSLASRRRKRGGVIQKKKKNLLRHLGWDGSLIRQIHFTFSSGKEVESGWTAQISSLKRDLTSLITSSSGKPLFLKRP